MEIVAMIPTYNESGNIKILIDEILALPLDIQVLVVDDNSPDKTHEIVENMAKSNDRVHLLLRKERRGRGWAAIDGFNKVLALGANYCIEMDGDGSHSPRFIPGFYKTIKETNSDIVSGSRYVSGGKDENRSFIRHAISSFARKYLSFVLGLKLKDPTSGFRMFSKTALKKIVPLMRARDPFTVTEMFFYAKRLGFKVTEFPIEFFERISGESKLKASTLFKYLFRVWNLKFNNELQKTKQN